MKPVRFRRLALISIFLLTAACPLLNLWGESPQPVNKVTPAVAPGIVLTGEDLHPLEIIRRLPETARPGDTLTFAVGMNVGSISPCRQSRTSVSLDSLDFLYSSVYHSRPRTWAKRKRRPVVGVRDNCVEIVVRKKLGFVEGLQALSTHIELARLTVHHHRALGDVGAKLAVGAPL
jgi:hypothetical protein